MSRQDSRYKNPEKGRNAECTYSSETGTVKMDRPVVTRMPKELLPKKTLYGELEMGKCSLGRQKERYKDTLTASLKDKHTNRVVRTNCTGPSKVARPLLVNMRQKQSAKPSRNVYSAKPELRHHQQSCLALTSVVPPATDSLEPDLV